MPLPRSLVRLFNLPTETGIRVASVELNSPAQRAGVQEGDIVIGFDDHPVSAIDDLHRLLTEKQVGVSAALTVLRFPEKLVLSVTPEEVRRSE